jgi:hypothetical protein
MDQKRGSLAMKISSKIEHKNKEMHIIFNSPVVAWQNTV